MTEKQIVAINEMSRHMNEETSFETWPPYPIIADPEGNMARLFFDVPVPEGWVVVGRNCAYTASLFRHDGKTLR